MNNTRLTLRQAWLTLVVIAIGSWLLVEQSSHIYFGTVVALVIAAIKVNIVVVHFMELRVHHQPWRLLIKGWTVVVLFILIGGYLYSVV